MKTGNELQKKLDNLSDEDNKFISDYFRNVKSNLWADEIELPSGRWLENIIVEELDSDDCVTFKALVIKE